MRTFVLAVFSVFLFASCNSSKKATTVVEKETVEGRSEVPPRTGERRGGPNAQLRQEMLAALNLSDEQRTKFDAIQQKYREKMQTIRENSGGDRQAMFGQMQTMRTELNAEISALLSEEQMEVFKEYQTKMRPGQRGGRRGGF